MTLDREIDVRTHSLAHRRNNVDRERFVARCHHTHRGAERVELHCTVSPGDHILCRGRERLGRTFVSIPAVGVGAYAVAAQATHQVVYRLAESLADCIPARDLE